MSEDQNQKPDDTGIDNKRTLSAEEKALLDEQIPLMAEKLDKVRAEINKVFKGQEKTVEMTLTTMVADGNLLMVGVPGLGKTLLVNVMGKVMGLDSKRVQFTPDLLPSDIIGSEIMEDNDGKKEFRFVEGPVFTQLLLADEINRAPPKTQSALLEAMQESKVTVNGHSHVLKKPFFVMATQNPIEQEGTYPLPEAQLDRFMMRLDVEYPDKQAEHEILQSTTGPTENIIDLFKRAASGDDLTKPTPKDNNLIQISAVIEPSDLILMRELAASMPISDEVEDAIIKIVRRTRPTDEDAPEFIKQNVDWGAGPRAVQAFAKAAKAHALMNNRSAPHIQDVLAIVKPVLEHRIQFKYEAEMEGNPFEKAVQAITHDIG